MRAAIIIFCTLVISCSQETSTNTPPDTRIGIAKTDNPEIFGNWAICSTSSRDQYFSFNVCPRVSFNNNGTGTISHSSVVDENFTWTLKNGALNIVYAYKQENQTFTDTAYFVKFKKQDGKVSAEILQKEGGFTYYLSR